MSSITIEYDGANIGKHTLNKHKGLLEQEGHGFECRNYVLNGYHGYQITEQITKVCIVILEGDFLSR